MDRMILSTLFGMILLFAPALAGDEVSPEPVRERARRVTVIAREIPHSSSRERRLMSSSDTRAAGSGDPVVHDPIEPTAVVQGMTETKLRSAGAFGDPVNGEFSGAAYVYDFGGASWNETAKLNHAAAAAGDNFGVSVSVQGDRIVVGADGVDGAGASEGAAFVFDRVGAVWIEAATLKASDAAPFDFFGQSVVVVADRVLVGAPLDDDLGPESGSAYVFESAGASWSETGKLTASDGAAGDRFGTSVSGELNVFLVGAFAQQGLGVEAGAAYLYDLQGGNWVERTNPRAPDGAAFDAYGISVAQSSGRSLIGAAGVDGTTGAAYILQLEATQHRFLLLGDTQIVVDRWISTRGNIHSNGTVDFMRGNPSTLTGNITSVGNVFIDRDHTIVGDVTSGGMVTISNRSNVTGTVTENTAVVSVPLAARKHGLRRQRLYPRIVDRPRRPSSLQAPRVPSRHDLR